MTTTYPQAIDEMFAMFSTAWNAQSMAIVGYVPAIRWPGVEEPEKPDLTKFWARVSQQTVIERQITFRNGVDKRYETSGLLFVQIFAPMSDPQAMAKLRALAVVARNTFRGKASASLIWFRNCRINELAPDGKAYRLNVVSDYQYDEIG
jgi:hypothetical protein